MEIKCKYVRSRKIYFNYLHIHSFNLVFPQVFLSWNSPFSRDVTQVSSTDSLTLYPLFNWFCSLLLHPTHTAMSNLTFQITPDSNKDSETIQMGRDLKLSCHVDATPQDKVNYTWYKNGAPVFNSDSLILLRSDPDMAPGTSSLEIVDMKFRDLATYSCVANFPGSRVPELRVDVNISQNSGEVFRSFFMCYRCQTGTHFHYCLSVS